MKNETQGEPREAIPDAPEGVPPTDPGPVESPEAPAAPTNEPGAPDVHGDQPHTPAPAEEAPQDAPEAPDAATADRQECVVDDGTPHVGRAVNGRVCSAHTNRYRADGSPREPLESTAIAGPPGLTPKWGEPL